MAEPTPFAMSRLFTQLVGREVRFAQLTRPAVNPAASKTKQIYGVYTVLPAGGARVVQADLPLLGSFAGVLLGLPSESIQQRVAEPQLDELLRDAIHEVLNVASTVVSLENRAVFQDLYTHPVYLPEQAGQVVSSPLYRSYFQVTMDGYEGGAFSLFAQ